MSNSSICPIDRTLSAATTLGHSGPGSDGSEVVLCIPQRSSITEVTPSDCLVSYPEHSLWESYTSVGVLAQSAGAVEYTDCTSAEG